VLLLLLPPVSSLQLGAALPPVSSLQLQLVANGDLIADVDARGRLWTHRGEVDWQTDVIVGVGVNVVVVYCPERVREHEWHVDNQQPTGGLHGTSFTGRTAASRKDCS
jgi:hypothetical protein